MGSAVGLGLWLYPLRDRRDKAEYRKSGLNRNKDGSLRNINGKVYIDFLYLGERVREPAGPDE